MNYRVAIDYHKGSTGGIINLGIEGALQLGRGSNLVQGLDGVPDVSWSQFSSSHLICDHNYLSFGIDKNHTLCDCQSFV